MSHNFNNSSLSSYSSNYSESKLWSKLRAAAKKAGETVVYYVLVLFYELSDPEVSLIEKSVIVGALGYFILPIDLVPDTIPVIGYADDLTALKAAYDYVSSHISPSVESKAQAKLKQWFG